jgi:hypothetical protein
VILAGARGASVATDAGSAAGAAWSATVVAVVILGGGLLFARPSAVSWSIGVLLLSALLPPAGRYDGAGGHGGVRRRPGRDGGHARTGAGAAATAAAVVATVAVALRHRTERPAEDADLAGLLSLPESARASRRR